MRRLTLTLALIAATSTFAHDSLMRDDRCTAHNFRFGDDHESYVEEQTIEGGSLRALKAAVAHAPITVQGGDRYSVKVCKAAARQSDLAKIDVRIEAGELKVSGPDHRRWSATYIVTIPRGGSINVETTNGPLSIRDVDGDVEAHAQNGPIAIRNARGSVTAETHNGPISIQGSSGTMKARANNGPLSVHLDGNGWSGDLDAATKNGPLTLKLPRNYGSSVVVETNGRGPISCRADGCDRNSGGWDAEDGRWNAPRKLEFGRGTANVRLSTVNGPVTVRNSD
jgi:hypothetical protein